MRGRGIAASALAVLVLLHACDRSGTEPKPPEAARVEVVSPAAGDEVRSGTVTVRGTASAEAGITHLWVSVNGAAGDTIRYEPASRRAAFSLRVGGLRRGADTLEVRVRDGLDAEALDEAGVAAVPPLVAKDLVEPGPWVRDRRVVLTRRGRLLADLVVRELLP